jgi:hypothetical protein
VRRVPFLAGCACLVAALIWHIWLADRWTRRIPPGWHIKLSFVGTQTVPDQGHHADTFPERDALAVYERSQRVIGAGDRPRSVMLESQLTIRDVRADTVIRQYVSHALVDERSGEHLEPDYDGDFVLFPRKVERRVYRLRTEYAKGIPLRFERIERINGLETYLFTHRGRGEYTAVYAGVPHAGSITVDAGQEVRCVDDGFSYRVWVEPVTGAAVKVEEACISGDYVYDAQTGRRLRAVARWSGATLGNSLVARAAEVRRMRSTYLWASRYIPLGLLLLGLGLVGLGLRRTRSRVAA